MNLAALTGLGANSNGIVTIAPFRLTDKRLRARARAQQVWPNRGKVLLNGRPGTRRGISARPAWIHEAETAWG